MSRLAIQTIEDPLSGYAGGREDITGARRDWIASRLAEAGRSEPIRIVIGSNTLTCGGAEHQILRLMPRLIELGLDVEHFYHGAPRYLEPRFAERRLTSHFIDLHELGRRRFFAEAAKLFRSRRYDIAHAFVGTANLYTRWAAARAGVPVVLGGWRQRPPEPSLILRTLYSLLDGRSGAWIVNSPANAQGLAPLARSGRKRIYVVPNAFDFGGGDPVPPTPLRAEISRWIDGRHAVVTLGRVEASKDYDLFIDIAASVTAARDDTCFVIIASTDHTAESKALEERLRRRISEEDLASRVLFAGRIDDAASLLGNFSLLLFTSRVEGSPNAVIEAMAAGLPIVMTRCTDTSRLVEEGKNGYTGRTGEELKRRVESILSDGEMRSRFGAHSRAVARQNFDAANSAWLLALAYLAEWQRIRQGR